MTVFFVSPCSICGLINTKAQREDHVAIRLPRRL